MAILDFPAAPTAGQVVTLTNGFSYQWDGAVWTLTPASPGQVAGGDLTGTYPNPTRDLLKVTTAKLAAGAATRTPVASAAFPANWNSATYGSWLTVVTTPSMTTRGGVVLILATPGGLILGNTNQTSIYFGLLRNAVQIGIWQYEVQGAAASRWPIPAHMFLDTGATGAVTYSYQILQSGANAMLYIASANTGWLQALEFA
jgi:hypothetical protein